MNAVLEGRIRSVASSRLRTIACWAATLLLAAEFGVGGVMDTLHLPPAVSWALRPPSRRLP